MLHNIVMRVVVLCLVSLVGGGLAAMHSSAAAATGTWVSPAWMAQGKHGGILKLVTNADPDHWDLDPRVRRAVYLAIDRQEIIQVTALGRGTMGTPFYPNTWMASPLEAVMTWPGFRQPKDADLAQAKQLLAEAGYADGFKTTFVAWAPIENMALMIKQHLKKIGIEIELKVVDTTTTLAAQAQGDYAMTSLRHGPSILDPDEVFQAMYLPGGPRNQLNWADAKLTELFEQQAREPDQARRRTLLLQAEEIIRRGETAWITLYWGADTGSMVNNKVKNYHKPLTVHTAMTHEHLWLDAK